ncbi:MAG: nucleotidyltransferase domain-containing protein [Nitrospiria bacterium]
MNDPIIERFLDGISPLKEQIEEIYLFGSRCRDDWRPDSDYDLLIVVKKKEREIINRFYDVVMDILLSSGKLISLKIFSSSEFNRLKAIPTPFISNILREGKKIGFYHEDSDKRLPAKS